MKGDTSFVDAWRWYIVGHVASDVQRQSCERVDFLLAIDGRGAVGEVHHHSAGEPSLPRFSRLLARRPYLASWPRPPRVGCTMAVKLFIVMGPGLARAMGSNRARKLRCSFDKKLDHTATIVDACPVSKIGVNCLNLLLFSSSPARVVVSCRRSSKRIWYFGAQLIILIAR